MLKVVFCLMAACMVATFSCSAADLDDVEYYSFDPLTMSALDYAVMPLAATSWDTADQAHLAAIRNAFYNAGSSYVTNSLLGWVSKLAANPWSSTDSGYLKDIRDAFYLLKSGVDGSIVESVRDISNIYDVLVGPSGSYTRPATASLLYYIYNLAQLPDIKSDTQIIEDNTRGIYSDTTSINDTVTSFLPLISSIETSSKNLYYLYVRNQIPIGIYQFDDDGNLFLERTSDASFVQWFGQSVINSSVDSINPVSRERTLYSRIKQLQEVLASDDDLALAESQKANREEIEGSFLTGSSGATSLGVSDFGDLADVGGTIKDSLSLDGNATIGSFTSGLAAADSAGQGWFSEETRSQLDAVSSAVTYSLRDPDPYNMEGWEDRYYWLLGDDE